MSKKDKDKHGQDTPANGKVDDNILLGNDFSPSEGQQDRIYGRKLDPSPIKPGMTVADMVDQHFYAYNSARLREACLLLARKVMLPDVTVGVTLSGALTPTGLGSAALVPLVQAGMIDWIIATGANVYHDIHRSLGFELFGSTPNTNDFDLRETHVIRIYDILFDQEVLLKSDAYLREVMKLPEFQKRLSTAEIHYLIGKYVREREKVLGLKYQSLLGACFEAGVPIYTSSPGDSTLGMNIAALQLEGYKIGFDPEADVNETTAIVHHAKATKGKSAVVIFGGGSPKNFILQTEPQIQEVLGIPEKGHDYFIQITDARVDTGGLSGATPSEAMTWGKVDPEQLPDSIVCYTDSTLALPVITAYLLDRAEKRPLKQLYHQREALLDGLKTAAEKFRKVRDDAARKY